MVSSGHRFVNFLHLWVLLAYTSSIIQDSSEDWEREAMTMDKVYTNGICNIAACDGTDSSHSLFSDPDSMPHPKISFKTQYTNGVVEFEVVPIWMDFMRKYSKLYKRGWAVQERFLSTRIMHLTKIPIWECRKNIIAEGCIEAETHPLTKSSASERELMWSDEQDLGFNLTRWRKIVTFYCQRELTFPLDKLVAIGGLAKAFSSLLREEYCAGIWGGELLVPCLLWRTFHPSTPSTEYLGKPILPAVLGFISNSKQHLHGLGPAVRDLWSNHLVRFQRSSSVTHRFRLCQRAVISLVS